MGLTVSCEVLKFEVYIYIYIYMRILSILTHTQGERIRS